MTIRMGIRFILLFMLMTKNLLGQSVRVQEKVFLVEQSKNDLQGLKKALESKHPNLYLYTPKQKLDMVFDSLINTVSKPLTELEFYKHLTVLSAIIKDGHTIILPSRKTTDDHNRNSKFLPYHLTILNNQLFVEMVCTDDKAIVEGSEILSINETSSSDIIHQLLCRQIRDGNNQTYPIWILNHYFKEYFSYIFGHPNQFVIKYKTQDKIETATINAWAKDSINYYKHLKYPNKSNVPQPKEGLQFKVSADNRFAILTIKDFHKDVLKKIYHQDFKKDIKSYFEAVKTKRIGHLIIDLRDNQGGDISYGVFLLSFLLDKEFKVVQEYYKVDKSKSNFQLKRINGEALGFHKPKNNVFNGKLFVLINGGSFSNSGIVASCLKRYKRATFIGEETGGNNKVLAGYIHEYALPNTGIQIQIPTKQFLLDEHLPLSGQGTLPDYGVQPDLPNILNNHDKVLHFAIDLIQK